MQRLVLNSFPTYYGLVSSGNVRYLCTEYLKREHLFQGALVSKGTNMVSLPLCMDHDLNSL